MTEPDYDVVIIGGGPAGSAMGAYLARAGVRCAILERALFPRPHVGESLVPACTRVFREIGFLDEMDGLGFPRKHGATWTSGPSTRPHQVDWEGIDPSCHAAIRFDEREQPGVDRSYTWHVDRGRFDLALLQHASRCGARVYEGLRVKHVRFDEGDPEVVVAFGKREVPLRCRLVVDASGRHTLLGRQLGLKAMDPWFDQYALHTWVRGYDRASMANPGDIHIHFLPEKGTWVWQIPIDEQTTSLGVVTQKSAFRAAGRSREAFFEACLRSRPDLGARYDAAERVRPLTEEADYSYAMRQFSGDRYLLLGDAARFVDPIFSSGVSIALSSARFASRDVVVALGQGELGRGRFATFEETMRRGVRNWYEFIRAYYRLNVLFSHFIRDPKYRLDVLELLQGDVYAEEPPPVLGQMWDTIARVEASPRHMWHGLLSDVGASPTLAPAPALAEGLASMGSATDGGR